MVTRKTTLTVRSRLQQAARVDLCGLADLEGHRALRYPRADQPPVAGFDVQSGLDVGGVDDVAVAVEVQRGEEAGERAVIVVPSAPIAELGVLRRHVVIGGIVLGGEVMEQSRLAAFGVAEDLLELRLVAGALCGEKRK